LMRAGTLGPDKVSNGSADPPVYFLALVLRDRPLPSAPLPSIPDIRQSERPLPFRDQLGGSPRHGQGPRLSSISVPPHLTPPFSVKPAVLLQQAAPSICGPSKMQFFFPEPPHSDLSLFSSDDLPSFSPRCDDPHPRRPPDHVFCEKIYPREEAFYRISFFLLLIIPISHRRV